MNKRDAVSKGGVGNESVGCGRRLGRGKIEVPEAGCGCTSAGEEQSVVTVDLEARGGEGGRASVITKLPNGEEGVGGKPWEDVGLASCRGETRKGQSGHVA
jgi:hypothetical protein